PRLPPAPTRRSSDLRDIRRERPARHATERQERESLERRGDIEARLEVEHTGLDLQRLDTGGTAAAGLRDHIAEIDVAQVEARLRRTHSRREVCELARTPHEVLRAPAI